ncbi:hypothetical protein [Rhizobium sp. BK379]|uniref:hypothetical protein n=1 Tax=Rhizobium sp. BK379 TaxID=2587059 RepID=UPI00160C379D|nr:hypothetical protein [Rhizobium sp. BK379]MBB3444181.1 hypothetical protein [Rhizobium sp. BK379]
MSFYTFSVGIVRRQQSRAVRFLSSLRANRALHPALFTILNTRRDRRPFGATASDFGPCFPRYPLSDVTSAEFEKWVKHVLVDLLRLLVPTGLHCIRDIAIVAERKTESIQDTRTGYKSAQAAK